MTDTIDAAHLARQRAFSLRTFGPGARTNGVIDHITKELDEVRKAPTDLSEWADVIILAFDGAWRSGAEPQQIIDAIVAKQTRNEARVWPDWRTQDPDKAIEHDRGPRPDYGDKAQQVPCATCGHALASHLKVPDIRRCTLVGCTCEAFGSGGAE
ncbi:hypothetical protein SEA_OHGEESY_61 [Gordonia phage Ohgeesy]|uniref:MazG-like nucleotide pyrophosphohydrolase n=1 Tax=Gordonia phage Ohgeesy TaxID=2762412 RepID=A0A7G8LGB8_9CAUD|nr:hypothetical protein PP492_gp61 [Gordonia phage Ohgeesy]QNJ56290.1 hypothetical protein SEA_OHGEESY_61 [Gordonia phage Ohgeesy]